MISVIVPIYNVEEYLPACIESILNQTYKDLEILLIDDGSTDNSGRICDKYAQCDNRCIVIHQLNSGEAEARNTGLDHANGEYISFIDGDDYIHPQMLEILYEALQKGDYDFSMTLHKRTWNNEKFKFINKVDYEKLNQNDLIYTFFDRKYKQANYPAYFFYMVWNKLYKKEIIDNIRFQKAAAEDCIFSIEIYLRTKSAIIVKNELYYWVQRKNSITHQPINQRKINIIISYYQCLQKIPKNKYEYRAAALEMLYKNMILYRFNINKSPWKQKVKDINKYIRIKTIHEFCTNKYISNFHKLIYVSFIYIPQLFKSYSILCSIKNKKI